MAGKRTASHDVSPRMRKAFFDGLLLEANSRGLTLAELCQTYWRDDWKAAASVLAKFLPREHKVEAIVEPVQHLPISETEAFINRVLGEHTSSGLLIEETPAHTASEGG